MISSWSTKTKDQLSKSLNVDFKSGISDEEALDRLILANKSTKKYGKMSLLGQSLLSYLYTVRFFSGLLLALMALYAGAVSLALFCVAIVGIDIFLWVYRVSVGRRLYFTQRNKEDFVVVVRSGRRKEVSPKLLVVGDVVILREGDMARSYMRIIKADNFSVNSSSYSENSKAIYKDENVLPSGLSKEELLNIVFPGDFVSSGTATLVVVQTANDNGPLPVNNLLDFVTSSAKKLFSNKKVSAVLFSSILPLIILVVSYLFVRNSIEILIIFFASIFLFSFESLYTRFLKICNEVMSDISRYAGVLKNVSILQKLKDISFIVLDKTGVFIEEELKLSKIYTLDSILDNAFDIKQNKEVMEMAVLSSELVLDSKSDTATGYGSPIDRAIIADGSRSGINQVSLERVGYKRLDCVPFSRERWFSAVLYDTPKFPNRIYFSGEPIKILSKSTYVWRGNDAPKKTTLWQEKILEVLKKKAEEGLKVVAISYKDVSWRSIPASDDVMQDSVFVGFLCFAVKTKKGVSDLVQKTKDLGIKILLVSGDYPEAVSSFARELGIVKSGQVLLGADIKGMDDKEIFASMKRDTVYAKISVEDRLRMVNILKDFGENVLVVGEKNEDLKIVLEASVGVASPIAKDIIVDVSDIISKSGFAGVFGAILSGRRLVVLESRLSRMFIINSSLQCLVLSIMIVAGFGIGVVLMFMLVLSILGAVLLPKDIKSII